MNLLTGIVLLSQGAVNLFGEALGGTGWDVCRAIVQAPDGGFAIAGDAASFGPGGDFLLIKLTPTGAIQWARNYGGSSSDVCFSMILTADSGFALVGRTMSYGAGSADALIVKVSSTGTLEWARTIGGTSYDYGEAITQTADGGYAVTGVTQSAGGGSYDMFAAKLSSVGALEWARTFGGTDEDWGRAIVQTLDGGYAVSGYTFSFAAGGNTDLLLVKLDASGNMS